MKRAERARRAATVTPEVVRHPSAGRPLPRAASGSDRSVLVLGLAQAAVALGLWTVARGSYVAAPLDGLVSPFLLPVVFGLVGLLVIKVTVRSSTHAFDLSEVPLVLGLFVATPSELLLAGVVGIAAAALLRRRQAPPRLLFNLSLFAAKAAAGVLVFTELADPAEPFAAGTLLAAVAAALAAHVLEALLTTVGITLIDGDLAPLVLAEVLVAGAVAATANASFALIAVAALEATLWSALFIVAVAAVLLIAYRSYAALRQKHVALELLYDFTRSVGQALQTDSVVRVLLAKARELLRADDGEITLLRFDGEGAYRVVLHAGDDLQVDPLTPEETEIGLRGWTLTEGKSRVVARGGRDDEARRLARHHGLRDALVAPLRREAEVVGVMIVGNRSTDQNTFDADDLRLFETLVAHASVSLENGRLVDQLREEITQRQHEALHDALTTLPNRSLFQERVDEALAARADEEPVGVMLIDLDRFKEVNDTLGHHNGDLLLQEVAVRLIASVDRDATVARLGGDEFAVLLPSVAGRDEARAAAVEVQQALERPFVLGELTLDVGASVGIAICPDDGHEAATLLQRADVAMYAAKANNTGVECYDRDADQYSPERLALVGELRAAIEHGELEVYYQPLADLVTGRVVGVEALVRWNHPRRGLVFPDAFIPMAEHVGLVRPLTEEVLRTALRQTRLWQAAGLDLTLSVNLSARSLLDDGLVDHIQRLLVEAGVSPSSLCLELTESSIMADPGRNIDVLAELSAMGCHLAVDDFGTGYSSLSYLKRLPVDEIKIDRSFVMNMGVDDNDAVIARSTIDLGRNLGLAVVAEGVENEHTWQLLADLGCDLAQGYFISRPVTAPQLTRWLAGWRPPMLGGPTEPEEEAVAPPTPLRVVGDL